MKDIAQKIQAFFSLAAMVAGILILLFGTGSLGDDLLIIGFLLYLDLRVSMVESQQAERLPFD